VQVGREFTYRFVADQVLLVPRASGLEPAGHRWPVRVTDNGLMAVWATAPYRVVAIDGTEVNGPTPVTDRSVTVSVPAGGRADQRSPSRSTGLR
jgi:hypothetical protein